jgi:hypothetical protein
VLLVSADVPSSHPTATITTTAAPTSSFGTISTTTQTAIIPNVPIIIVAGSATPAFEATAAPYPQLDASSSSTDAENDVTKFGEDIIASDGFVHVQDVVRVSEIWSINLTTSGASRQKKVKLSSTNESILWVVIGLLLLVCCFGPLRYFQQRITAKYDNNRQKMSSADQKRLVFVDADSGRGERYVHVPPCGSSAGFYRTSAMQARKESERGVAMVDAAAVQVGTATHPRYDVQAGRQLGSTTSGATTSGTTKSGATSGPAAGPAAVATAFPKEDYRRFLRATFFTGAADANAGSCNTGSSGAASTKQGCEAGGKHSGQQQRTTPTRSPTYRWIVGGEAVDVSDYSVEKEGDGDIETVGKALLGVHTGLDADVSVLSCMGEYEEFEEGSLFGMYVGVRESVRLPTISKSISPELFQELHAFSERHGGRQCDVV